MASRRQLLAAMVAAVSCQPRRRRNSLPSALPAGLPAMSSCCPALDAAIVGAAAPGNTALLFLHGYGQRPDFFLPRAQELVRRGPLTAFLAAAPLPHPSGGRAWWHFDQPWPGVVETGDEQGPPLATPPLLMSARVGVQQLLLEIQRRHRPRTLVLAGFSQGAMLAIDVALAANPPVDRVVAMSGGLLAPSLPALRADRPVRLPAFVTHGTRDKQLARTDGEVLADSLRRHGHPVTWRPFDGGHQLPPEQIFDELARFVLNEAGKPG
jgi:phospholipase/carboxylesterase